MFSIKHVEAHELSDWLAKEKFLLLDVRTPGETAYGIIPGAKLLPLHLIPLHLDQLKGHDKVVVYCQSGARSAQACMFLARQGIEGIVNLSNGIMSWAEARLPLVRPDDDSHFQGG